MALNIPVLRQNWATAIAQQPNLARRFLDILVSRYPDARPVVARVPREALESTLNQELATVMTHLEDRDWLVMHFAERGRRLRQLHGVSYVFFGWAGECLLAALAAASGKAWSADIARAWVEAFGSAMDVIVNSRVRRLSEPKILVFKLPDSDVA